MQWASHKKACLIWVRTWMYMNVRGTLTWTVQRTDWLGWRKESKFSFKREGGRRRRRKTTQRTIIHLQTDKSNETNLVGTSKKAEQNIDHFHLISFSPLLCLSFAPAKMHYNAEYIRLDTVLKRGQTWIYIYLLRKDELRFTEVRYTCLSPSILCMCAYLLQYIYSAYSYYWILVCNGIFRIASVHLSKRKANGHDQDKVARVHIVGCRV